MALHTLDCSDVALLVLVVAGGVGITSAIAGCQQARREREYRAQLAAVIRASLEGISERLRKLG